MKLYRAVTDFNFEKTQFNGYIITPRRPRDTDPALHEITDTWFFQQFGIRARSQTIFCTPSREVAGKYLHNGGHLLEIDIPPDEDYQFIYSPTVEDLFVETYDFSAPFNATEIHDFLESKNYRLSGDIAEISPLYRGEIMLFIHRFFAKEV